MRSMCTLRSGEADTGEPDAGECEWLLLLRVLVLVLVLVLLRSVRMLPLLFRDDEAERVRLTPFDPRRCWGGFWRMEVRMLRCVEFLPLFLPSKGSLSK